MSSALPLRFALKQTNIESVSDFLLDVSHPGCPNYGKHWTAFKIARQFAPSGSTIDAVRSWLLQSDIEANRIIPSACNGWINVRVSVEEAESLMNNQYSVYKHVSGTEQIGEAL